MLLIVNNLVDKKGVFFCSSRLNANFQENFNTYTVV